MNAAIASPQLAHDPVLAYILAQAQQSSPAPGPAHLGTTVDRVI